MEAVAEIRRETPAWDFALGFEDSLSYPEYVCRVDCWSRGEELPPRFVPNSFLVGVVEGTVVGRVSIRHQLNEFLARIGGHVGYGVRPGYRRRGYATEMLRLAIPLCAAVGIDRALLTCDIGNVGSMKVIERCGGVFEGLTNEPKLEIQKRRYWIQINKSTSTSL